MNEEKTQELLLKLIEDTAWIKAKLTTIESQQSQLVPKVDALEQQNANHERSIRALEHRSNELEEFVRNNMIDSKKQQTSVTLSVVLALGSAFVSFLLHIF